MQLATAGELTKPVPTGGHVWRVDVRVQGNQALHHWSGWACDDLVACRRARNDARTTWPARDLFVVSCVQVGV